MKRIFSFLLVLCMLQSIMAQTVIICNAEGELSKLLEENAKDKTALAISGPLNAEDIKAINKYAKLEWLNLRNAKLSTIPEKAWNDLEHLSVVDLPLEIDTLNLNAFSYKRSLMLVLTGDFPYLQNQPKDNFGVPIATFPEFVVEESNAKLDYMSYANEIGVFSADNKVLYKSFVPYGDASIEEVMPYAYLNVCCAGYVCIGFSSNLKRIANNAFEGLRYQGGVIGGIVHGYTEGLEIFFEGKVPPEKFDKGNFNIGYIYPSDYGYNPMKVIVSDKETYIKADSSWGDLWLVNESEWGNRVDMVKVESSTSYYDLQGRKVTNPTRGIYIKDGKKVVIE